MDCSYCPGYIYFQGAALGILLEEALLLERLELVADGGWGGEAGEFANLTHGGREAVCLGRFFDGQQDFELAGGQAVLVGWAVWELCDLLMCAHGIRVGEDGRFVEHLFAFVGGSVYSFFSYRCSNPLEYRW